MIFSQDNNSLITVEVRGVTLEPTVYRCRAELSSSRDEDGYRAVMRLGVPGLALVNTTHTVTLFGARAATSAKGE